MATTTVPPPNLSSVPKSNLIIIPSSFSIPCNSKLPLFTSKIQSFSRILPSPLNSTRRWRVSAAPYPHRNLLLLLEEAEQPVVDSSQIIDSAAATDDGVSSVISALLFFAFIGLSILTIGVIYIAVTDFLQKREREKFDKEEAAKKKNSNKKGKIKARARAGPKGFGQKIEEDDDI